MTVVDVRSYSRTSGKMSALVQTGSPGARRVTTYWIRASCAGLA